MKLAIFLPIFGVFLFSNLRYSSAFPTEKDADYDENKLGEDGFGGFGSAGIKNIYYSLIHRLKIHNINNLVWDRFYNESTSVYYCPA